MVSRSIEAVEKGGECAKVQAGGADAEQMRLNAAQFAGDGAEDFAAWGKFDSHQLFGGAVPGELVVDGGGVIHPIDDGYILIVVEMFPELFEAAMEITDVGRYAENSLAVEFEDETKGCVRCWMLRPEIEGPAVVAICAAHFRGQKFC